MKLRAITVERAKQRMNHGRAVKSPEDVTCPQTVAYVSLHRMLAGQGGHTHIHEIQRGLRDLGWTVESFVPEEPSHRLVRVRQFITPQLRLLRCASRVDVVYVRHHPLAVLVALWCEWRKVPRVEEINGTLDDWYDVYPMLRRARWIFSALSRLCLRSADGVVAVSDGLASWARSHGASGEVQVVANAADPDMYRPKPASTVSSRAPYVVYAGALTPWEGVSTVLDAVRSPQWPLGIRVVIAGSGPLGDRVRVVAGECSNLDVVGVLSREDVAELLAGAMAALSPFWKPPYGASPIKLYEAMATGTPVVASDSPGQAEIVRAEACGLVVPPNDAVALCQAVRQIAEDPQLAAEMGSRGRQAALARHNWAERGERTSQLLDRVITASRAS